MFGSGRSWRWRITAGVVLASSLACASSSPRPAAPPLAAPAARRAALLEAGLLADTVPGPAGRLHVFAGGRGPILVLVHGSGGSAGDWYRVVPALARRYTLLVPDLPGHGESEPTSGPLPVADLAAALGAVIDARGAGGKVVLAGNSLGGWVSLLYAGRHADRVERVVGISSSGIFGRLSVSLQPKDREQARSLLLAIRGPSAPAATDAELDAVIAAIAAGPVPRLVAGLRVEDFLESQAAGIRVPVDLVWGEEDGVLVPDYGRRLAALLPDARLHLLPRCGHMPQVWCPEALAEKMLAILGSPPGALGDR